MPKPVRTRPRGAVGAATLFALGVFFSCCGCSQSFSIDSSDYQPRKIVYVLDRSDSMCDSFHFVKYELKRSVGELSDSYKFHIIFFSSGPPG